MEGADQHRTVVAQLQDVRRGLFRRMGVAGVVDLHAARPSTAPADPFAHPREAAVIAADGRGIGLADDDGEPQAGECVDGDRSGEHTPPVDRGVVSMTVDSWMRAGSSGLGRFDALEEADNRGREGFRCL